MERLRARYGDLSTRFKAVWTFHQFLLGLAKLPIKPSPSPIPADFKTVYADLKVASGKLTEEDAEECRALLSGVDERLERLTDLLLAQDNRLSTSLFRQFLQRVKSYDEQILTELIRFYLFAQRGRDWNRDRLDKADLLLTRLAWRLGLSTGGEARLHVTLADLWDDFRPGELDDSVVKTGRESLAALHDDIAAIETFEGLEQTRVLERYRELKHRLGPCLIEPGVATAILTCNRLLHQKVEELNRLEAERISRQLEEIDEFGRQTGVAPSLEPEIAALQEEVERYERGLENEDVRVDDLSKVRRRVESILPRLKSESAPAATYTAAAALPFPSAGIEAEEDLDDLPPASPEQEILGDVHAELLTALGRCDARADSNEVATRVRLPVRIEGREVLAYRRLAGDLGANEETERFVLSATAMRWRLRIELERLALQAPDERTIERARATVNLADSYRRRFDHLVADSYNEGDEVEAASLKLLQMLLMRDLSDVWLAVNGDAQGR